ncbi:MAG TPA: hypothetical protein VHB54_04150 [Mucilaginibacter sp.]|nr:hypothetical protein [Mucilaginibacter sp.]
MKPKQGNKSCPSSTCHSGAQLLGVVGDDRKVHMLNTPIPVDDVLAQKIQADGDAEKKFRFAGKCAKCGCAQWTGTSCGVMDELAMANHLLEVIEQNLPECVIRKTCRWYSQEGAKACMICPYVVTQSERPETAYIEL